MREPAFLILALEFGLVIGGEWAFNTALAIQAYELGGPLAVGLIGARFVPAALGGLPLGALGDRIPPGWVLCGTAAARCAAVAGATLLVLAGTSFVPLLIVAIVDAVVGTAYRPAQARLVPALAQTPADVAGAAALLSNTKTISQVAGALLAGMLLTTAGVGVVFAAPAVLFLIAAIGNAALAGRLHAHAAIGHDGGDAKIDWLGGARILFHDRLITHVAGLSALRAMGRGLWLALATLAALGFLELGKGGVALMLALSGIGVLVSLPVGALLVARPRLRGPLTAGLALCGIPLVALALAGQPGPAFACVIVWGFGMSFADVILTALQFRVVDAPLLSRTVGAIESMKVGAEGLGALLAPALVALFGLRPAIAIAGAFPAVMVLLEQAALRRIDGVAEGRVDRLLLLRRVPLFGALRVEALERLAAGATPVTYPAGVDLIVEGDRDAKVFYVIEEGTAQVRLSGWPVAELGPGEGFGERALLRDTPRSATVRSLTDITVQEIGRETFLSALIGTDHVAQIDHARAADLGSLVATLRTLPLLQGLDEAALNGVVAAGRLRSVEADEAIVRQGDAGDELFVILSGGVRVDRDGAIVAELFPGEHFGEIALLHEVPRSATVTTTAASLLLAIDRATYRAAAEASGVEVPLVAAG
ncbi:unannotated protein [freshwater metagenome]|uniref:Unannotated protein n=1 Tax=freshwater metagenome TaxID=449393 RepID=A0A6J7GVQ9_9ZZZZ